MSVGLAAEFGLSTTLVEMDHVEKIEPAPGAYCCAALGCTEGEQLLRGVIDGFGSRVLCARHLAGLIKREAGRAKR